MPAMLPFRTLSPNPNPNPIPLLLVPPPIPTPSSSTLSFSLHLSSSLAPIRAVRQHDPAPAARDRNSSRSRSKRSSNDKDKKKSRAGGQRTRRFTDLDEDEEDGEDFDGGAPAPMPKAPAGFVLDPQGNVLMASSKRLISIVDPVNNCPLECVIRRVFKTSRGQDCMLLCPVDMPVLILRSSNFSGWASISDEETEAVLPAAAYALAKIHIHLVNSGFYMTARGFFCFGEEDIFEFKTDDDVALDGMSNEGVEVTCFNHDGAHYMIYTPCDPVLFVAVKDTNGELKVADDDLMDDPAVSAAVDEEAEFNAMVEEELELRQSVMGERDE